MNPTRAANGRSALGAAVGWYGRSKRLRSLSSVSAPLPSDLKELTVDNSQRLAAA